MKFKDLYNVLVTVDFYQIKINIVERETLEDISSGIYFMKDLDLEYLNDKEVQCIHSMRFQTEFDYNITLYN